MGLELTPNLNKTIEKIINVEKMIQIMKMRTCLQ